MVETFHNIDVQVQDICQHAVRQFAKETILLWGMSKYTLRKDIEKLVLSQSPNNH